MKEVGSRRGKQGSDVSKIDSRDDRNSEQCDSCECTSQRGGVSARRELVMKEKREGKKKGKSLTAGLALLSDEQRGLVLNTRLAIRRDGVARGTGVDGASADLAPDETGSLDGGAVLALVEGDTSTTRGELGERGEALVIGLVERAGDGAGGKATGAAGLVDLAERKGGLVRADLAAGLG